MIPALEARRRLDSMIEAARDDDDGKCQKTFHGHALTILIHPDEPEPAYLWGDGQVPIGKHLALRAIEMYGC
jgi:hypothetical protein